MESRVFESWGRVSGGAHIALGCNDRFAPLPLPPGPSSVLPFGNGRSYGDSCLNAGNALIPTRALDRFIAFDPENGVLRCEAGVLLSDLLRIVVPKGWFPAVAPGTRFVTVGGAIANDVHGKNHHMAGTFGRHVRSFELLRSDGTRMICSRESAPDWFSATIGGLGLTGLITWAELKLRRIESVWIESETVRFDGLEEFFRLSAQSDPAFEYTVSWLDCSGRGRNPGRGLLIRGRHAAHPPDRPPGRRRQFEIPFTPPFSLVNPLTVPAFNAIHSRMGGGRIHTGLDPFFFPLDSLHGWNRLYGPRGFFQYQFVVPPASAPASLRAALDAIGVSGITPALTVLKTFGDIPSPGLLSFPAPGVTLAMDFQNRGEPLHRLFDRLDAIVREAGGRLYPAKDGRMPWRLFRAGFPSREQFTKYIDPRFSSSFWRRVTEGE